MSHLPQITRPKKGEIFTLDIPICCREGHDDCPHVEKPFKKAKTNIGL